MQKTGFDTFFGDSLLKDVKKMEKGWSEEWLRMRESNLLELGQNKIGRPMEQSYIVYRAIRALSENIPQAIYRIYDVGPTELTEISMTDPLSKLFNKPNHTMSRYELWESIAAYLNLQGESFIYMAQSLGQLAGTSTLPAELWSLNPMLMKHSIVDGKVVGWVYNNEMPILPEELIHIKLFHPRNNLRGLSPLLSARIEMETDYSASRYNKRFFDNGANPDGVVSVDKDKEITIEELRKLKRLWNQNHQGTENAHRTAFLLGGMTYSRMSMSQKDAEFIQGREFSRSAILSVFGVPKFVAGYGDKGEVNRSTADAAKALFWTNTILPQLQRIQEKLMADFFLRFAPGRVGKFDTSGIPELKVGLNESLEAAQKMFLLGYTRNEVNARLQLNMPIDPDGDTRYLAMNLIEVGDSGDAQQGLPKKQISEEIFELTTKIVDKDARRDRHLQVQARFERILHKKIKRYLFNIRSSSLKIINNVSGEQMIRDIQKQLKKSKDQLQKLVEPVFRQIALSGINQAFDALGVQRSTESEETKQTDEEIENIVNQVILAKRANKITGITDNIFDQLKSSLAEGINEGEAIATLAERTRGIFNVASNRSLTIARTESNSILNGSATEVYKKENVQEKEWITTLDGEARDSHIAVNGEIVGINQEFSNGLQYPGDIGGPAEEVINCRCAISPVVR